MYIATYIKMISQMLYANGANKQTLPAEQALKLIRQIWLIKFFSTTNLMLIRQ